jgi:hypothetical protein
VIVQALLAPAALMVSLPPASQMQDQKVPVPFAFGSA